MRNPIVVDRVLTELRNVLPTIEDCPSLTFDIVHAHTFPYTMAVFNETLRLYPPVPVELKECTTETTFPDGTWLPKGSVVMWAPWSMGRSKQIWGQDADSFTPERWLTKDENGKVGLISKTAFEFPVFNGGPRSCLGKNMAELLGVYVVASLVWRFKFSETIASSRPLRKSRNSLTLPMEGGLPCLVAWRNPASGA